MKTLTRLTTVLLCALGAFALAGCSSYPTGTVKAVLPKDDITASPELTAFVRNTPNIRVVLRVPTPRADVTGEEMKQQAAGKNDAQVDLNSMYARIDKNLMKAGFVVRDRALLSNLIRNEQMNYVEIGKKIETDIIIEILKFDFRVTSNDDKIISFDEDPYSYYKSRAPDGLYIERASLDCKIIIVEKGQTGAILTLNYAADPYRFNAMFFGDEAKYGFNNDAPTSDWIKGVVVRDKAIDYFSQRIIDLLKGR